MLGEKATSFSLKECTQFTMCHNLQPDPANNLAGKLRALGVHTAVWPTKLMGSLLFAEHYLKDADFAVLVKAMGDMSWAINAVKFNWELVQEGVALLRDGAELDAKRATRANTSPPANVSTQIECGCVCGTVFCIGSLSVGRLRRCRSRARARKRLRGRQHHTGVCVCGGGRCGGAPCGMFSALMATWC